MNGARIAKAQQGYEGSVPRCATCKHFKPSRIILTTDSKTTRLNHHCGLGGFGITPNGCCDVWRGADGSVLDEDKRAPLPVGEKFACPVCSKQFSTMGAARQHTKDAHR